MNIQTKQQLSQSVAGFHLPRYHEIPNVGLYLEQTAKYISEYLDSLGSYPLTGSMIGNYVKKGLVANPVKKQYDRDQIAYLIFIAVSKIVLPMDDIHMMIDLQKQFYSTEVAYDYFCSELENVLFYTFGLKDTIDVIGTGESDQKTMLRNTIITVAYKIYLDKYCRALRAEMAEAQQEK